MEGVEEFKADGATVRVMHDPQDNTAGCAWCVRDSETCGSGCSRSRPRS